MWFGWVAVGRTSDDFPDAHARPVLISTLARVLWVAVLGTQIVATLIRRLWAVYDTPRLMGTVRLGLCAGFFHRE
jgi:hypothetical protein